MVAAEGVSLPEADPREHIRDHCWERYNRPSMLQHIQSGRATEIDALNGALVRRAKALGIACAGQPHHRRLAVKGLEAAAAATGKRSTRRRAGGGGARRSAGRALGPRLSGV